MRGLCNMHKMGGVVGAGGDEQKVVSEGPRFSSHMSHLAHPRAEKEGDEEHGKGASLRNAARLEMGGAKAQAKGVKHGEAFKVTAVSIEDGHRHACDFGKVV